MTADRRRDKVRELVENGATIAEAVAAVPRPDPYQHNSYEPGTPLELPVLAVGRPVLAFGANGKLFAGQVVAVLRGPTGEPVYDVAVLATARPGRPILHAEIAPGLRLGDALNPQPNTFVFTA